MPDTQYPIEHTPKQQRRIISLENKIKYRRHYLTEKRASINGQFDKRDPSRMNEHQLAHWTKFRDDALAQVDELEVTWLAPLESEYRNLLGLD